MIKLFKFCKEYGLEIHMRYEPRYDLVYYDIYKPRTGFAYIHPIQGETLKYLKDPKDIEEFENYILEDVKLKMFMHSEGVSDVLD